MTAIYVVRHAIAEERDADRWPDDAERPLTADGEKRFRDAARGLRTLVSDVDVMLSSPYVRAWRTAEILHEVAGWPAPERSDLLGASRAPADGLDAIGARPEASSIAVVGHEPYLSQARLDPPHRGSRCREDGSEEGRRRPDRRQRPALVRDAEDARVPPVRPL